MKNLIKILLILSSIFLIAGCSSSGGCNPNNSSSVNPGGNTGGSTGGNPGGSSGGNTGGSSGGNSGGSSENPNPSVKKHLFIGGFSYFETADGKKYIWGNVGELKNNGNTDNVTKPMEVSFTVKDSVTTNGTYDKYTYGKNTYYVLTDTGLYAWGYNEYGQVGNGKYGFDKDNKTVTTPYKVAIDGSVNKLITNGNTVYAITDNGLYAWGDNKDGQVGNRTYGDNVPIPTLIQLEGAKSINELIISGPSYFSTIFAITDAGLYAWGDNRAGQVDSNSFYDKEPTPKKIEFEGSNNIKELITDGSTVYAKTDAGFYAWGDNIFGQIDATKGSELKPTKVTFKNGNVTKLIVHNKSVYAITDTKQLYAWGYNKHGQIGNGESGDEEKVTIPHKVDLGGGSVKEIIVTSSTLNYDISPSTVYAMTNDGQLYAWGYNANGKVGSETPSKPTNVLKDKGRVQKVINNYDTVYAITDTGLYAWGKNTFGQVGNGTPVGVDVPTPAQVTTIDGNPVRANKLIVTNSYYMQNSIATTVYAITDSGLYAWGQNYYGQVADLDSLFTQKPKPYKVEFPPSVVITKFVTNGYSAYAITNKGLYAWGRNASGQIDFTGMAAMPTNLLQGKGSVKEIIVSTPYAISAFSVTSTVYAITDTGLYAWGDNKYGQVGNNTTENKSEPYKVELQ